MTWLGIAVLSLMFAGLAVWEFWTIAADHVVLGALGVALILFGSWQFSSLVLDAVREARDE